MQFLTELVSMAFHSSKRTLLPILIFRMVKTSVSTRVVVFCLQYNFLTKIFLIHISFVEKMSQIEYGLCEISSIAFSGYGTLLVSISTEDDIDAGYRMGRIGIEIMKKFDSVEVSKK